MADYFRPSSHSQIAFGELAGSNGLLGGKSVMKSSEIDDHGTRGVSSGCNLPYGRARGILMRAHTAHVFVYSVTSSRMRGHQYRRCS